MKKLYIAVIVSMGLFCFMTPAHAEPKEETQQTITELQERLSQLNDEISTTVVEQEQQEKKSQALTQELTIQEKKVTDMTDKLTQLEKEIQERVRAIQLKDADRKVNFFQLEGWTKMLSSIKGVETVRQSDDAKAKEYTELTENLTKQQKELEKKQEEYKTVQEQLQTTMATQQSSKEQLEKELKDNEALLAQIQEEERKQEEATKAQQEALLEQVVLGQNFSTSEEVSDKAQAIILSAKQYLGVPYVWGGTTPSGFDCSGLMQWVFAQNGVSIPRVSQAQQAAVKEIPVSEVQPGDLVFWGRPAHHVALYIGDGYFIQAPQPGDVVKITHTSWYPFESAGRVLY
ncbi:C40 family peptidase [Candidatus Enterococcus ferrettii]|uniref:Peptidoglycan DL-endopeptidase CwlO n=1 Tax=Candidatus Enterococcus ferrettii TaxID=2815324 RepID=A0ABV0EQU2_9ENTE|nr:C40 family peptidase [Enterococcus sp. 665A]MBO1339609.1 C40 family peptidase [Enterococcus sp. 665A]